MPIYAYKCGSCGHAKDVLQKLSDAPLSLCPACGAEAFSKQLTAAGFQLKGSGWYVTDFRGGDAKGNGSGDAAGKPAEGAKSGDGAKSADPAKPDTTTSTKSDSPAAAAGCGGGCACH